MKRIFLLSLLLLTVALTASAAKEIEEPTRFEYKMGVEAYKNGDYRMAWDYLRQDSYLNPKSGWPYARMAFMMVSAQSFPAAFEASQKALKLLPEKAELYMPMCLLSGMLCERVEKDTLKAINFYKQAIKACPDTLSIYFTLADAYYNTAQYKTNEKLLKSIAKKVPEESMTYLHACRNYTAMERFNDAISAGFKACSLDSTSAQNKSFLASALMGNQLMSLAGTQVVEALELDPDYPRAQNQLQYLYYFYFEYIDPLVRAMCDKHPQNASWYLARGNGLIQKSVDRIDILSASGLLTEEDSLWCVQLVDTGIVCLEHALLYTPVDTAAMAAMQELENDSAAADYVNHIYYESTLSKRDGLLSYLAAVVLNKHRDYVKALGYYNQLVRPSAIDYYNIACCYNRLQQPEIAIEKLRLAAEEGYSDAKWTMQDPDLQGIEKQPGYAEVLSKITQNAIVNMQKSKEGDEQ